MIKTLGFVACFAVFALGAIYAAPEEDSDLLQVLLDNGTITREQYDRLKKEAPEKESQHIDVNLTTDGGLQASTYDGKFSFKLGGVFASDMAFYQEDKNPLGNGTEIRSARIEMAGTLFSNWDYDYSIDFAGAAVKIKDASVRYRGSESFSLNLGQFKPPFSLEEMGQRKHLTFLERALPNALVPDRRMGVGANYYGNLWTAAAGIFGEAFDSDAANEGDEGWMTSGRFTFAPVQSDKRVFHLGASAAYQVPNDEKTVKIDPNPESHLTGVSFLDTGKIKNVNNVFTYGLESAVVYGPFSLQGEYIHASLSVSNNGSAPVFQGGYAFASWMITGESRNYRFRRGSFGRIKPDRTYGAFELAVRYSTLDLNSPPAVSGGRENNITLALNWYLNRNIRVMTNYVLINNDVFANDRGNLRADDNPGVFQARLQIDF